MKTLKYPWYEILNIVTGHLSRILLYGPPDTGKTTAASKVGAKSYRVQCSRQQGIEDLLGSYVLENGETKFIPGPVALAMTEGATLVIDEFDMANPAHASIWHAVLDDPQIACVRLPNGAEIKPAAGFKVIATTNATPVAFSAALQRRFELKLYCGTAHPDALASMPKDCAKLLLHWQSSAKMPDIAFEAGVSSLRTFITLKSVKEIGEDGAAQLVFAGAGKEFLSTLASNRS